MRFKLMSALPSIGKLTGIKRATAAVAWGTLFAEAARRSGDSSAANSTKDDRARVMYVPHRQALARGNLSRRRLLCLAWKRYIFATFRSAMVTQLLADDLSRIELEDLKLAPHN